MKGGTLEASGEPLVGALETLPVGRGVVDDAEVNDVSAAAYGLFGRDEVLRSMHRALLEGGSAVVTGEPGLGKSSLLRVADQLAQRAGRRVLAVTPTLFDRGLPFSGLAELAAQVPKSAERALPEPQRRALAVALRQQAPEGREADPLAVQLAVRTLLTELCGSGSVTLIVDDLQWLDPASAASLGFALRRLAVEPARLSVLVGTRPAAGIGAELTSGLPGPVNDIRLAPLEDWAMGQLLREHLGARWTPPMSSGVEFERRCRICAATEVLPPPMRGPGGAPPGTPAGAPPGAAIGIGAGPACPNGAGAAGAAPYGAAAAG